MLQKEGKKNDGDKDSKKEEEDSGEWSSCSTNQRSFKVIQALLEALKGLWR